MENKNKCVRGFNKIMGAPETVTNGKTILKNQVIGKFKDAFITTQNL